MVHIGLVTEGSHDYFMLEPLLSSELQQRGANDVTFDRLQPTQDATGYYPDGGYTRVIAWCQAHAGNDFDDVLEPIIGNIPRLDGVLVHLDGDAASQILPYTQAAHPQQWNIGTRVRFLTAAVEDWLQLDANQRKRLIVAAPVLHTEAWMNASISNTTGPYEVADAKSPFRRRRNKTLYPKLAAHYQAAGQAAALERARIASRCLSYRLFQQEIVNSILYT